MADFERHDLDTPASAQIVRSCRHQWAMTDEELAYALGWFGDKGASNIRKIEAGESDLIGASLRLFNVYRFSNVRPIDWPS